MTRIKWSSHFIGRIVSGFRPKGDDRYLNIANTLGGIVGSIPQILIALLVFGLLVFVHELGHFAVAKWSGIKVIEFAIGMGPTLIRRERGETVYSLKLFPVGGFCAFEGDDGESSDPRSINRAKLHKRVLVMAAGSIMNLLLGLLLLGILSANQASFGTTRISGFTEDSVTSRWLQIEDVVRKINGHRVNTDNDMLYELLRDRDGVMDFEVTRDGETVLLESVAFTMEPHESGVQLITIDFGVYRENPTLWRIVKNTFNLTESMIKQVWGGFTDLITRRYGFNQLSGPVGMTTEIGRAASYGWRSLLTLVAIVTVNLGVFNLLPLPALDGGRLVFLAIEAVRRKPIDPKYEGYVHTVGFFLLIGLIVAVTFSDVAKIVGG